MSIIAHRYAEALYRISQQTEPRSMGVLVQSTVRLLAKRQLLGKLDLIVDAFRRYASEMERQNQPAITLARTGESRTRAQLTKLDPRLGKARITVDHGIIGGFIIRDKSTIIDASVKRQCQELLLRLRH